MYVKLFERGGGGGGVQSTYGYIPKTGGGGGRQKLPGSSISYAMGGAATPPPPPPPPPPKAMLDPGLIEDGVRSTSHHSLVSYMHIIADIGVSRYLWLYYVPIHCI